MSAHTPGPWTLYDDSNDGKTNRIEIAAIGKTVARIYHSAPEEDLPNARLIAAAPELIQELEIQYAWLSDIHHEWEGRNTPAGQKKLCRLRNLTAKAYGISEQEAQDGVFQRVAKGAAA